MMATGIFALPPGLRGYVAAEEMANQRAAGELGKLRGIFALREALSNEAEANRRRAILAEIPAALESGDRARYLGLVSQVKPESALPYVVAKPGEGFTLSPGQVRYGAGNQPVAGLPKTQFLDLGDRQLAVDPAAIEPGTSFDIGVSPTTRFVEQNVNERYDRPSASTIYSQQQQNLRHQTPSASSQASAANLGPGVYRLPNGSTISHPQLMAQWRTENNLMDPLDLQILGKTDPERAMVERDKISRAMPFQQWARGRFGIDVTGGYGQPGQPVPRARPGAGAPQLGPQVPGQNPPASKAPQVGPRGEPFVDAPSPEPGRSQVQTRRRVGGKSYVKIDGQWYEE
jgi:hypothetical protein